MLGEVEGIYSRDIKSTQGTMVVRTSILYRTLCAAYFPLQLELEANAPIFSLQLTLDILICPQSSEVYRGNSLS